MSVLIEPDWQKLTKVPGKRDLFDEDPSFRAGWRHLQRALSGDDPVTFLWPLVSVMIKPDCLASGRSDDVLRFMAAHGYRPVLARRLPMSASDARELWAYQWNRASADRIRLTEAMFDFGPSLYVVYRREPGPLPASVEFRSVKGSTDPDGRAPGTLRAIVGGANRMLSAIHTADEPADLIRELGILLGPADLVELVDCVRRRVAVSDDELRGVLADVSHGYRDVWSGRPAPEHRPVGSSPEVIGGLWASIGSQPPEEPTSRWSAMVALSSLIVHDIEGVECTIASDGREEWVNWLESARDSEGAVESRRSDGGR